MHMAQRLHVKPRLASAEYYKGTGGVYAVSGTMGS